MPGLVVTGARASAIRKGEVLAYVGRIHNLKDHKGPRNDAGLCCGSRLRKGEVFAFVGRNQNLKDLKAAGGLQ